MFAEVMLGITSASRPREYAPNDSPMSQLMSIVGATLELVPYGELRLPRRRVDVRQQLARLSEQRLAAQIVASADVRVVHVVVRAVEHVEQLRDELHPMLPRQREEFREPQVDVREART